MNIYKQARLAHGEFVAVRFVDFEDSILCYMQMRLRQTIDGEEDLWFLLLRGLSTMRLPRSASPIQRLCPTKLLCRAAFCLAKKNDAQKKHGEGTLIFRFSMVGVRDVHGPIHWTHQGPNLSTVTLFCTLRRCRHGVDRNYKQPTCLCCPAWSSYSNVVDCVSPSSCLAPSWWPVER